MSYQIKYPTVANALYQALLSDSFYATLAKTISNSLEAQQVGMLKYLDYSMQEASQFGVLLLPSEHQYGASIWSKPLSFEESKQKKHLKETFIKNELGESAWNCYHEIVTFMDKQIDGIIPDNIWYLSILGLHPRHQNKGLGSGLVQPILSQMDKLGVPTYLETFTPRNISFYKRLGYKIVDSFLEPTTKAEYWVMVR